MKTDLKVGDIVTVRMNTLWGYTKAGEIVAIELNFAVIYHPDDDSQTVTELSRLRRTDSVRGQR
jgi:hypothetical protein